MSTKLRFVYEHNKATCKTSDRPLTLTLPKVILLMAYKIVCKVIRDDLLDFLCDVL